MDGLVEHVKGNSGVFIEVELEFGGFGRDLNQFVGGPIVHLEENIAVIGQSLESQVLDVQSQGHFLPIGVLFEGRRTHLG